MFVRLSYHNIDDLFILFDAGVIDLKTKSQVSLSEIEDYDNFGWLNYQLVIGYTPKHKK